MSLSLNTNVGAMAALRSLGANRAMLDTAQARLASGLEVPSVRENAANWSIAQRQRGDIRALGAVSQSLQRAQSVLDVAISAGEQVSELLLQMKEKALAAADTSLSADARSALNAEFGALRDRIAQVAASAEFGGRSLVGAGASDQQALAWHTITSTTTTTTTVIPGNNGNGNGNGGGNGNGNGNGNGGGNGNGNGNGNGGGSQTVTTTTTTHELNTLNIRAASLALGGANVTVTASDGVATVTQAAAMLSKLNASIANVGGALARFGSDHRAVGRQLETVARRQDVLEQAVSNLVDADVGREAARATALRARETLILHTLSLANAAPSRLLSLFEPRNF